MKKITMYYEEADGQLDRCTGLHIEHGDGTASWLASGGLDAVKPDKSPLTWREIGERARDDAKVLPKWVAPTPPVKTPTVEEILAADAAAVAEIG